MPQGLAIATVDVSFPLLAPNGSAAAPSYSFAAATGHGMYADANRVFLAAGGSAGLYTYGSVLSVVAGPLAFSTNEDVILTRDAANVLAQRNGVNAQEFRVYNTYTDAGNYSRFSISTQVGYTILTQEGAGTGANGSLVVNASGTGAIYFNTAASSRWGIYSSGSMVPQATGAYDLGESGARVRRILLGGNTPAASAPMIDCAQTWNDAGVTFVGANLDFTDTASAAGSLLFRIRGGGTGTTSLLEVSKTGIVTSGYGFIAASNGFFQIGTSGFVNASADGVWGIYNNAGTSFGRLCFGGTTSSFPSWQRSGTYIAARLADDSDDTTVQAKSLLLMVGGIGWSGYTSVINQQIRLPTSGALHWGNSSDTGFTWIAARSIACGMDPSATPQAQAFTIGERARGGTDTNVAGSNGTLRCGTGTGNAAGASLLFETPTPTASGSVQQSYAQRLSLSVLGATFDIPDQGLRINNQVNGAGASAGTLTNAPSAGNPNFWLPISIAGTVRFCPLW